MAYNCNDYRVVVEDYHFLEIDKNNEVNDDFEHNIFVVYDVHFDWLQIEGKIVELEEDKDNFHLEI